MNKSAEQKNIFLSSLQKEQHISLLYAELLGICTSEQLRNKLLYAQSNVNTAVSTIIDETNNRGWIESIPADDAEVKKMLFSKQLF